MPKKYYIEVTGCQMNKSDAERMSGILENIGYEKTNSDKNADLLLLCTCAIRQASVEKAYSQLGVWGKRKKKSNPNLKIGICGCVSELEKSELFKRRPYLDLIFGTHNIFKLAEYIERINNGEKVCEITSKPVPEPQELNVIRPESAVGAWIPIIEGCNNFCTYCVVPYTRGRERSRLPEAVIAEAKKVLSEGKKEITLLGQNVDSYGKDFHNPDITLANLLRELNKIEGKFRIRFVTSYPSDITDDLLSAVEECDKVCEYFHIPMQSGNNKVLKDMNRRYNREEYTATVKKIRDKFPDVTITSDFIAGFPGETEEEFCDTLSAIEELKLDYSNTAIYSPRPMTKAAKMTDKFIPDEIKSERYDRLQKVNAKMCLESNMKYKDKIVEILCESSRKTEKGFVMTGRMRNNKLVHFNADKDLTGNFVDVRIIKPQTWCLYGNYDTQ